jgi:hypothetical protein
VPPLPQPRPEPEAEPDAIFKPPKHYSVQVRIKKRTTTKTYHHVVREPIGVYDLSVTPPTYSETFEHPALVPGDVEIFEAEFLDKHGNEFSYEKGVWTLVQPPRVWHAVLVHHVKHAGKEGTLTVHLMEDFDQNGPYYFAITGGTQDFKGAYGQITYVGDMDITFDFRVPPP